MIDLLPLLARFRARDDVETAGAFYKTRVPEVAPLAYLNILFKPASPMVVAEVERALRLPAEVVEFFAQWNGLALLSGTIDVYGCLPRPHPPIDRTDPLGHLPFDLLGSNIEQQRAFDRHDVVCVGSYGLDRSRVCVRRSSGDVFCTFGEDGDLDRRRATWPSFSAWLVSEVERVGMGFDDQGRQLLADEALLPGTARPN